MTKEDVEKTLSLKVNEIFGQLTNNFEYGKPVFTLEISPLVVKSVRVAGYISTYYNSNNCNASLYLYCDGDQFALDNYVNHERFEFNSFDSLNEYLNSDKFIEDVKKSHEYKYCTDTEYRENVIREYTKNRLKEFEENFISIIENVGGKEVMRILSPLNSIVAYGGDFEAVSNLVQRISNIMKENRDLKLNK